VILTQGLCEICALDYNDIVRAARFRVAANYLSLNPHRLAEHYERCSPSKVLILVPCGFQLDRTIGESSVLKRRTGWARLSEARLSPSVAPVT
jgi:hypothetical protein